MFVEIIVFLRLFISATLLNFQGKIYKMLLDRIYNRVLRLSYWALDRTLFVVIEGQTEALLLKLNFR